MEHCKIQPKTGLSQEALKLLACAIMLLDHVGATLLPGQFWLRCVGRLAFPIFCFLISEGLHYTRSPERYLGRLAIGAVLSQIPFEMALFGSLTLRHTSVMLTLLLGAGMVLAVRNVKSPLRWLLPILFMLAAELLNTDYGGAGVAMVGLFAVTRGRKCAWLFRLVGLTALCAIIGGPGIYAGPVFLTVELLAVPALIPIACYHGKKLSSAKWLQWAFYLFYPVHLTVLWLLT